MARYKVVNCVKKKKKCILHDTECSSKTIIDSVAGIESNAFIRRKTQLQEKRAQMIWY